MGGCPRRRSPSAWPGSIIIAKPAPILLTGGQRNVQAPGAWSPYWASGSGPRSRMSATNALTPCRSEPQVTKTAKSSKTIRANKRKARLRAKHRRQRARATA
jgi:hypothetical protein